MDDDIIYSSTGVTYITHIFYLQIQILCSTSQNMDERPREYISHIKFSVMLVAHFNFSSMVVGFTATCAISAYHH
jgi:hypothetical protein